MKVGNLLISIWIGVFVVLAIMATTGSFSVIGELENSNSVCEINDETGGECNFNLTLPLYREVTSYKMNLDFDDAPSVYSDEIELTAFASVSGIEEDDKEDPTNEEELETNYVYFYRVPSSWPDEDIYSIRFKTETTGTIKRTHTSADGELEINSRYINKPYLGSSISKCSTYSSCSGIVYLIENYPYKRSPYEMRFRINFDVYAPGDNDRFETRNLNELYSGKIFDSGEVLVSELNLLNITNLKTELLLLSHIEVYEHWKGYVDWSVIKPPKTYISYAKKLRPDNVDIKIGDTIFQSGIRDTNETIITNDMTTIINEYCLRETSVKECVVPITIISDTGGKITFSGELAELLARNDYIPEEVIDIPTISEESDNLITGYISDSFDFKNNPLQTSITLGVIFIFGLVVIYLILIKKK